MPSAPATERPDGLHTTSLGDSGRQVVFCHGLFGQGKNWTTLAKTLAEEDHRVLLVDMPNHGRSEWTETFSYVDAADRVAQLLSAEDPVALVGHSMGGKIAMVLALRHPELVDRLCVVDISPVAYEGRGEFEGYVAAMQAMDLDALERRADADAALVDAVPSRMVRSFLLQNLRHHGDQWSWQPNLGLIGESLDTLGGWPADELAGTAPYPGPTLWVGGAKSGYITDETVAAMDRWFPHNRRVTVKNAGHWVHSEQPAVFAEVMRRFLA